MKKMVGEVPNEVLRMLKLRAPETGRTEGLSRTRTQVISWADEEKRSSRNPKRPPTFLDAVSLDQKLGEVDMPNRLLEFLLFQHFIEHRDHLRAQSGLAFGREELLGGFAAQQKQD